MFKKSKPAPAPTKPESESDSLSSSSEDESSKQKSKGKSTTATAATTASKSKSTITATPSKDKSIKSTAAASSALTASSSKASNGKSIKPSSTAAAASNSNNNSDSDSDTDIKRPTTKSNTATVSKQPKSKPKKPKKGSNSDTDSELSSSSDDEEDNKTNNNKSSITTTAADYTMSGAAAAKGYDYKVHANSKIILDDETDDDPTDIDEFRRRNRTNNKSIDSELSLEQRLDWLKFRLQHPIPIKTIVSAGANSIFRKLLLSQKQLIHSGIPNCLRRSVWEILSNSRCVSEKLEYVNRYQHYKSLPVIPGLLKQITNDSPRSLRGHSKYLTKSGQLELISVLSAFSVHCPSIGYCNSMSHIAGFLLLYYPEERAFWILCAIVDNILPSDYFTNSLLGVRADCQLIKILLFQRMPKLFNHLSESNNIDPSIYCLRWLMSLYLIQLPIQSSAIKIIDCLLLDNNSNILIQLALALFIQYRTELMKLNGESLYNYLDKLGSKLTPTENNELFKLALGSKCKLLKTDFDQREIELKIMEIDYMKELQTNLKFKRIEEERRIEELKQNTAKIQQSIDALQYGTEFLKIGASGKPKKVKIYLQKDGGKTTINPSNANSAANNTQLFQSNSNPLIQSIIYSNNSSGNVNAPIVVDTYSIYWDSKKKNRSDSCMKLIDSALFFGLTAGQFSKRLDITKTLLPQANLAFSIINYQRSLDLVALTTVDYDQWMDILMKIPLKEVANLKEKLKQDESKQLKKKQLELSKESIAAALNSNNNTTANSNTVAATNKSNKTGNRSSVSNRSDSTAQSSDLDSDVDEKHNHKHHNNTKNNIKKKSSTKHHSDSD